MVDGSDEKGRLKRDRSCLMVVLKWQGHPESTPPLVVVSTHLAKDPYNAAQTRIRVRQVAQIMASLTEFTREHGATESPVVLCGDLNARHLGEIRGIARTVWQIKGAPIHKFLWSATDVNTGPTSITKARQCRIDVVQFLNSHMEVLEVVPVPRLPAGEVIPNCEHPSDHFPVCARFVIKENYHRHRDCARAWLECVAGREKVHPLTDEELSDAFEFFDREKNFCICRYDLEEACIDLRSGFDVDVQQLLLNCFPDNKISYGNFIRAYEVRLSSERMRCRGDLEHAFRFFAGNSGTIELKKLESIFREITPISFSDAEVKEMIRRLDVEDGQEFVNLREFCEVVCKATFPHREVHLRKMESRCVSSVQDAPGNSSSYDTLELVDVDSSPTGGFRRQVSKDQGCQELGEALAEFHANLAPSHIPSPVMSPKLPGLVNTWGSNSGKLKLRLSASQKSLSSEETSTGNLTFLKDLN
eukprot:TRINITY_DN99681_c0_g1_i1.p1 TRINITY_DN99681_c0_g1~~TRINITY_DN99681_c0_g1_i1.p1  ORF type:complete len:532 (-),score=99.31 TRINITY_DN99681_c0_g1_i1:177-1595(-)